MCPPEWRREAWPGHRMMHDAPVKVGLSAPPMKVSMCPIQEGWSM
eukprot:COSAG04_NODE_20633_length_389_cov_1.068966_1_plen_44_part_10